MGESNDEVRHGWDPKRRVYDEILPWKNTRIDLSCNSAMEIRPFADLVNIFFRAVWKIHAETNHQ